ncbi:MAG TPA: peptide chain release factor N(5)-glutamine methyltransferase [Candidatus Cloacimonas sp.]|nr:peptide chain release factor N(5)-glutamine methyltransferase [Candidatus Cloacimonas sp.]HPS59716.1 peptide chain release factor N(5)-glutamine methyltransferase [Candidatus Cloacimonas sp.]
MKMTVQELLEQAKEIGLTENIPFTDFRFIISFYLQLSSNEIFLHRQRVLTPDEKEKISIAFKRLAKGEPPQYIIGRAYFYGLELKVNPAVLIPRFETERLVELTLQRLHGTETILDIGTGSGAIAIALKQNLNSLNVLATDISPEALEIAKDNAAKYQTDIHFYLADCFPATGHTYSAIISNPPYISQAELAVLDQRVREQEPRLALLGGIDGLEFYRKLFRYSSSYLIENGFLAVEHSETQKDELIAIAQKEGWTKIETFQDWNARDRYLFLYKEKGITNGTLYN